MNEEEEKVTKKAKIMTTSKGNLRALGFCGADDSVNPKILAIISNSYPLVEFGVLFRPDKEGEPRYGSPSWVEELKQVVDTVNNNNTMDGDDTQQQKMKLAAHLCGTRVDEVLDGNDTFIKATLKGYFQRIQINATAVNGVDMSKLNTTVEEVEKTIQTFLTVVTNNPEFEFIIQKNDETKPLWEGVLKEENKDKFPKNISMLVDESKGTGVISSSPWPTPPALYNIGYAGGIGPNNIETVLKDVIQASEGKPIWIDMESSLRSKKNGKDVFDLDKCYQVIEATCDAGLHTHPTFLQ